MDAPKNRKGFSVGDWFATAVMFIGITAVWLSGAYALLVADLGL